MAAWRLAPIERPAGLRVLEPRDEVHVTDRRRHLGSAQRNTRDVVLVEEHEHLVGVLAQEQIDGAEEAGHARRAELAQREAEVAERDAELATAASEHEMLNRLRERYRGEHDREQARVERNTLDEIAVTRFRRSPA